MTLVQNEKQVVLITLAALFSVLPTGAVGIRIWARRASGKRVQLSDGLIVLDNAALLVFWALVIHATIAIGTKDGDMRTNAELAKTDVDLCLSYHRVETSIKIIWSILVYFLKFSTLALFQEMFHSASGNVKMTMRILTYTSVVAASASITATLYIDTRAGRWCDLANPPTDMRLQNRINGLFGAVSTIVLDFAIFCIPIWQLWSVRLQGRKTLTVMISFGLGFLTCVVALIRAIVVYPLNIYVNALVGEFLLGLEPSVGIIAVCIPFFHRFFYRRGRSAERVQMHRLPSRAGAGDLEDGIRSATTVVVFSQSSKPR